MNRPRACVNTYVPGATPLRRQGRRDWWHEPSDYRMSAGPHRLDRDLGQDGVQVVQVRVAKLSGESLVGLVDDRTGCGTLLVAVRGQSEGTRGGVGVARSRMIRPRC